MTPMIIEDVSPDSSCRACMSRTCQIPAGNASLDSGGTHDILRHLDLLHMLLLAVPMAAVNLDAVRFVPREARRGQCEDGVERVRVLTMIFGGKPALANFSPHERTNSAP